jgi:hypothetical protein
MRKNPAPQSGLFNPRPLVAFSLCATGAVLAMFSLAATPPTETTRATISVPPAPTIFPSTFDSNANRLPPGVPLPPSGLDTSPGMKLGAQFSLNNRQEGPSSSSPTAAFPPPGRKPSGLDAGVAGVPLRPGMANGANSPGNPVLINRPSAPVSGQQAAASERLPLASGAQGDWSIVNSPNPPPTRTPNVLSAGRP